MPALAHHGTRWRRCVTRLHPVRGTQTMPSRLSDIIADAGNFCDMRCAMQQGNASLMIRYWPDFRDAYVLPLVRSLQSSSEVEVALVVFYTKGSYRSAQHCCLISNIQCAADSDSTDICAPFHAACHVLRTSCCLAAPATSPDQTGAPI